MTDARANLTVKTRVKKGTHPTHIAQHLRLKLQERVTNTQDVECSVERAEEDHCVDIRVKDDSSRQTADHEGRSREKTKTHDASEGKKGTFTVESSGDCHT